MEDDWNDGQAFVVKHSVKAGEAVSNQDMCDPS